MPNNLNIRYNVGVAESIRNLLPIKKARQVAAVLQLKVQEQFNIHCDRVLFSAVASHGTVIYDGELFGIAVKAKFVETTLFVTVQLDPCLDDCVMFAKRLKNAGRDVKLDILEGLPHGFLNFSLISKDAYEGSKVCVQRMKELLNYDRESFRSNK